MRVLLYHSHAILVAPVDGARFARHPAARELAAQVHLARLHRALGVHGVLEAADLEDRPALGGLQDLEVFAVVAAVWGRGDVFV